MSQITFSLTNLAKFISFMSPFLIIFFMLMISILKNTIVKGLIFAIGITIITFINYILKNTLQSKQNALATPFCNLLPSPFTVSDANTIFNSPSLNSTIIGFTLAYLVLPMKLNNEINPGLLTFLVVLLVVNGMVEVSGSCCPVSGVVLGALVGITFGILYYVLIQTSGNQDLAYFSKEMSDNTQCRKAGNKKFRCTVYKNGVPIS